MKLFLAFTVALFSIYPFEVANAEGNGVCRLTVRTFRKEGSNKLEVTEIETGSRKECQQEAESRKINSDPDVKQVQTSYSWRVKPAPKE